ncbi:uncharacterized protein LOC113797978 [Dermatophagoides pteronyssinus]|uniref:uncharacterized protein LOC113797978 n=1 Tax=Dermatophagoides pteronyssinus TaxID=6956 RepID=UPI003F68081E
MFNQNGHWIFIEIMIITLMLVSKSYQHGKMMEPPARNSAWRAGFPTHIDYNDNELFCGGLTTMWQKNNGKCGICGDSYSLKQPRPYESGGIYAKNVIVRSYRMGSKINVIIFISANHKGKFSFGLCPRNDPQKLETEKCFIPLMVNGQKNFELQSNVFGNISLSVTLPKNIECKHCVLRWHWRGGNNWGMCPNGKGAIGCGPQETFRNCADIVIRKQMNNSKKTKNTTINENINIINSKRMDKKKKIDKKILNIIDNEIENEISNSYEIKNTNVNLIYDETIHNSIDDNNDDDGEISKKCSCTCSAPEKPSSNILPSKSSPTTSSSFIQDNKSMTTNQPEP